MLDALHHVTCVCSDAQRTVDFYRDVLGFTLVKKTVNFDDPHSYHLYFGDEHGSPGTLLTFFEWPRAERGRLGRGKTSYSTPSATGSAPSDVKYRWLTSSNRARGILDASRRSAAPTAKR